MENSPLLGEGKNNLPEKRTRKIRNRNELNIEEQIKESQSKDKNGSINENVTKKDYKSRASAIEERNQNRKKVFTEKTRKKFTKKLTDWRLGNFYLNKFIFMNQFFFMSNILSILTGIIWYELDYKIIFMENASKNPELNSNLINQQIEDIQANYDDYIYLTEIINKLLIIMNFINDKYHLSSEFKLFLLKAFLIFVGPYFFLDEVRIYISIKNEIRVQKFNYAILSFFLPLRLFLLIEFFLYNSRFFSPRVQRFFSVYKTHVSLGFALKGIIKSHPKMFVTCLVLINILMNSFLIYIWERVGENYPNQNFDNFFICIWFCIVTMTTLGYGEYTPTSIIGRIICVYIILIGIIVISMITVILTEIFIIRNAEQRIYDALELVDYKDKINNKIKELVVKTMKFYKNLLIKYRKKKSKNLNEIGNDSKLDEKDKVINKKEEKLKEKKLDQLLNKLGKEKLFLMKEIKTMKKLLASKTNINYYDIISERLNTIKTTINKFKEGITDFQDILENSMEINRSLVGIENAINN